MFLRRTIIYEDGDIIVLSKQSRLTVHPGAGTNNDTLLNAVIAHLGKIPYTNTRPGIVHRLDKDTSGLMVIAKNEQSHSFLSELLSNRKIKREYLYQLQIQNKQIDNMCDEVILKKV